MTREAPQVAGSRMLGTLVELRDDTLRAYLRARRDYGDVVRFPVGPPGLRAHLYAVFSPDGVQQVLGTRAAGFRKENSVYAEIRASIGNGLLTSQDDEYLFQRRLVQPLFTRRRVDGYAAAVHTEAAAVADRWAARPDATVDVASEMAEFALRAISRILFGADLDETVDVVRRCFPVLGEHVLNRGANPLRSPRSWPTPANRRAAAAQRELYAICDRIIAERHASRTAPEGDGDDMMTLLIKARDADGSILDAQAVRDQVLVFLLAGHETTATALAFALHLLALHPKAQERTQTELDDVLGGRAAAADDLDRLPYLTMVLKEAMRLYPSVAIMGRKAVTDTEIGGFRIPAGADVYVSPYVTHRHPAYWDDPEAFDPERFTPQAEADRPRYAFFPFGGGPRACIGQHFSMLEATLALATLLQRFTLTAVDTEIPLELGMTMRAAGPVRVRLTSR
ncbi:cytochrome P450 [Streptomyces sp. NPDC052020]|uniref:cytochrome P450 n=1 Tax=Streptomyces sp. NPDC052020 TaxID=3155677 RepID=UPI00342A6EEB